MKKYFRNVLYNLKQLSFVLCLMIINLIYTIITWIVFPIMIVVAFSWKLNESNEAVEKFIDFIQEIS